MKVVGVLVVWLGMTATLLWWLDRNGLVGEDEVATMVLGSLALSAFGTGLLLAGLKTLVRKSGA